jgi:IS5 family transposase
MKRSKRKALSKNKLGRMTEKLEHLKASVRAKVEHPFPCHQEPVPSS